MAASHGGDPAEGTAYDVSDDGSVVVGQSAGAEGHEAFRWTADEGMVGLGDLPGGNYSSTAVAVSGNGEVVVGGSHSATGLAAFIWTEDGGMRNLREYLLELGLGEVQDWTLDYTDDVSSDGMTIIGHGWHDGEHTGWVARIPEPSSFWLLLAGVLLGLAGRATPRMRTF